MKKIIHMSDLHVGYEDSDERFSAIVQELISSKGDEASDYVIVITGDLANDPHDPANYQKVKVGLDQLKQAGFEHILVVPGNHDYGPGNRGDKKFVPLFQKAFHGEIKGYPRKDIIDGIAFIGLDSMADELHWYDDLWAEGELGRNQLSDLDRLLRSDDVRACRRRVVYLHHHPFKWRPVHQLKDSRKFKKVLRNAMTDGITIDALLFGHNHEGEAHSGHWGIARCYDAGTATVKPRPKYVEWSKWFKVKASTRIIDMEQEDVCVDHELLFACMEEVGVKNNSIKKA